MNSSKTSRDHDQSKRSLWPWFVVPIVIFTIVVSWMLFVAPDLGSAFPYSPGD